LTAHAATEGLRSLATLAASSRLLRCAAPWPARSARGRTGGGRTGRQAPCWR
jgi:hypothetical protein